MKSLNHYQVSFSLSDLRDISPMSLLYDACQQMNITLSGNFTLTYLTQYFLTIHVSNMITHFEHGYTCCAICLIKLKLHFSQIVSFTFIKKIIDNLININGPIKTHMKFLQWISRFRHAHFTIHYLIYTYSCKFLGRAF